jgi:hypothetical protein
LVPTCNGWAIRLKVRLLADGATQAMENNSLIMGLPPQNTFDIFCFRRDLLFRTADIMMTLEGEAAMVAVI